MMTSSAEIDVPGVESMAAAPAPEPWAPTTVFATNNTFIKTLNNIGYWIESVFPAYKPVPLIPPAQVAKQVYETVQSIFNNSLVNGKPTPLSIPVYVLMVAAYQRYYELGNNHLPTATYTQSQTLLTVSGNIDLHDQDGDLVIATLPLSGQASKGVVLYEALTGLYTYTTLDPGMLAHGGTDSFTITLDDSLGSLNHPLGLHTTTVTIPINYQGAGNNAPLWAPTFGATDPMGVIRGNVGAWDIDGDELTYSLANSANGSGATATSSYTNNGGIVNLDSDGSFTYIPKDSFLPSLADWFTVTVDDGWGGASDIPVILPFTNLNVAAKETGTDPDDGAVSGKLVTTILGIPTNNSLPANDLALFTYTGTTPARGSVTFNPDATFTYTPTPAARHQAAGSGPDTDSFKIIGVDGSGRTLQLAEVTVDISPTNTPPTGGAFSITSVNAGNGVVTGSVTGTDDDGDTLAFGSGNILFPQLITTAQLNTVNINPDGTFTFSLNLLTGDLQRHTAAKDNATTGEKTDTFTVQMNDGHGGTADIGVTVPIAPKNTNPVMTTGVPPLIKTKTASWTFVAPTDADLDLLDWVLTGPPANGSVSWLLGTVTYTSNGGSIFSKGPDDSFEITVYDGHGGSDAATFHY
jgi:VCBS repeat-containing protein